MGDAQRLGPEEQISLAREQFESATDLTVAVEEEFAVLDPETLDLTNPVNPQPVGVYNITNVAWPSSFVVSDDFAYIADAGVYQRNGGLEIVDLSNPANLRHVGAYETGAGANGVSSSKIGTTRFLRLSAYMYSRCTCRDAAECVHQNTNSCGATSIACFSCSNHASPGSSSSSQKTARSMSRNVVFNKETTALTRGWSARLYEITSHGIGPR